MRTRHSENGGGQLITKNVRNGYELCRSAPDLHKYFKGYLNLEQAANANDHPAPAPCSPNDIFCDVTDKPGIRTTLNPDGSKTIERVVH